MLLNNRISDDGLLKPSVFLNTNPKLRKTICTIYSMWISSISFESSIIPRFFTFRHLWYYLFQLENSIQKHLFLLRKRFELPKMTNSHTSFRIFSFDTLQHKCISIYITRPFCPIQKSEFIFFHSNHFIWYLTTNMYHQLHYNAFLTYQKSKNSNSSLETLLFDAPHHISKSNFFTMPLWATKNDKFAFFFEFFHLIA